GAWAVACRLPAAAAAEAEVSLRLGEAETLGIETQPAGEGRLALVAYFRDEPGLAGRLARELESYTLAPPEPVAVPDVDWVARFREGFCERRAGGFLIVPAWRRPAEAPPGSRLLVVDPGRAFGTGTHETTRLCLAAIEELAARGPLGRTLDVGTGSGILAVAAAALGASPLIGVDIDPEAVAAAQLHARLNGITGHWL